MLHFRERVRAGLQNTRAKGKKLGRPQVAVDVAKIARLRRTGASWRYVAEKIGVGGLRDGHGSYPESPILETQQT